MQRNNFVRHAVSLAEAAFQPFRRFFSKGAWAMGLACGLFSLWLGYINTLDWGFLSDMEGYWISMGIAGFITGALVWRRHMVIRGEKGVLTGLKCGLGCGLFHLYVAWVLYMWATELYGVGLANSVDDLYKYFEILVAFPLMIFYALDHIFFFSLTAIPAHALIGIVLAWVYTGWAGAPKDAPRRRTPKSGKSFFSGGALAMGGSCMAASLAVSLLLTGEGYFLMRTQLLPVFLAGSAFLCGVCWWRWLPLTEKKGYWRHKGFALGIWTFFSHHFLAWILLPIPAVASDLFRMEEYGGFSGFLEFTLFRFRIALDIAVQDLLSGHLIALPVFCATGIVLARVCREKKPPEAAAPQEIPA